MVDQEQSANEFAMVKNAVAEMLAASQVKTLQSAGTVQDLTEVRTNDSPPLYLVDYLDINEIESRGLNCEYTFTAEGEVTQQCP
jgi:hypothetical protein